MASKLLDENVIKQVKELFVDLNHPVKIIFFGSDKENCEYCQETQGLLSEIVALDERFSMEVYDIESDKEIAEQYQVDKVPTTLIAGVKDDQTINYGVQYAGIPAGHEFTSLVNSILMVSKQDSGLSPSIREALAKLEAPVNLKVFVTPTCPYCPRAVIVAHQMAIESPYMVGEMVEAMEFQELSNRFNVSGVPHTVINDGSGEVVGAVPEEHLMDEIQKALSLTK